ncbi:MAG TPA: POTRA domain-containing protein [Kofleriaceae bacterium]|jgi:outer membrane protein insertion porin family
MKRLIVAMLLAGCGSAPPPEPQIPPPSPDKKAAAASIVEWQKLVGSIKAIDVNSPDATLVPKVKDAMAGVVGKPLDRRELRGALTIVAQMSGVSDASVRGTQLADGIQLVVDITPQPTLHALVAREVGGKELALAGQLTSAIGLPVDPQLLDTLGKQIYDDYTAKGYADASVAWKQTPAGSGAVDVAVEVTPGKLSTITAVDFKGNAHVKKADLLKALGTEFAANTPWTSNLVARGWSSLTNYYYDHGYVNVAVESPLPPGQPGPLVYAITEGDQFRVGKLDFPGVPAPDAKKYIGIIGVKQGQVFNRTAIAAGLKKVEESIQATGDKGFVLPKTTVDAKKKVIDLTFELQKG